jgi:hypothetical protein
MKKIILTVLICLSFIAFASAQTDFMPTFEAGVKGGANYTLYPAYPGYTNKGEFGYIGGFWANMTIFNVVNFQPEIYGIEKSTMVTYQQTGNSTLYTEKSHFTTADIPLLFGAKFGSSTASVRIYTGPVLSLVLSKVQSFTNQNIEPERLDYNDQNISWQFGAGLKINKLTFDIRYEAGISKTTYGDDFNAADMQISSTHLNSVSFTIGYTLFSDYGNSTY